MRHYTPTTAYRCWISHNYNTIGDDGVKALVEALHIKKFLEHLWFNGQVLMV